MNFAETVARSLKKHPEIKQKLAKEFEIAESTVERWAKGTARLHPQVQKLVTDFIKREGDK